MTAFIIFQSIPRNAAWVSTKIGGWMVVNLIGNACWLPLFQNEIGKLWVSVGVIAGGILLPLAVLHWRFWRPANLESTGWAEFICVHPMISLYMGWVSVATIANVSLALTPSGEPSPALGGWSPSNWSMLMQCVAATLAVAVVASTRGRDWIYPIPIAWALAAIGVRQRDPAYPGGQEVVNCAFALAALVGLVSLLTALKEGVRLIRTRQRRREEERRAKANGGGAVVVGNPAQFVGSSAGEYGAGAKGSNQEWR